MTQRDPSTKPVVERDVDGLSWCPESELCPWFETPEESGGRGWKQFCSVSGNQISAESFTDDPGSQYVKRHDGYLCKAQMILDHQELVQLRAKGPG